MAEQREHPSGMRGSVRSGSHRCGTGLSDTRPVAAVHKENPVAKVWGPWSQPCPGMPALSREPVPIRAAGDSDQTWDPVLQGSPSLPPARDRPVAGCPSAPAQPGQGTGTMSSLCGAGRRHDPVWGSKGSRANLGSGDQGPHPTVPWPRRCWRAPADDCTHLGEDVRAVWGQAEPPVLPRVPYGTHG